jgi:hypothetical protein
MAKKFGFLVDFDLPTRLVYNVNSPVSERYFNMYNLTGPAVYKDATGTVNIFEDPHYHTFVYTIFGDNKGSGYTQSVIHGDKVIGSGAQRHIHEIDGFTNVHLARHPGQQTTHSENHYHIMNKITRDNFFDKFFTPIIYTDIDGDLENDGLRQTMLRLYNTFVQDYPNNDMYDSDNPNRDLTKTIFSSNSEVLNSDPISRSPRNKMLIRKRIKRHSLSAEEFNDRYNFNYFLPFYVNFRLIERGFQVVHKQTTKVANKFYSYLNSNDYNSSLETLDSYINKEIRQQQLNYTVDRIT